MNNQTVNADMKLNELKEIAAEYGVKYRVGTTKVAFVVQILEAQEAQEFAPVEDVTPEIEVEETEVTLTTMEKAVLNGMRENEFNDALDGAVYSFSVIDNSGLDPRHARGAISSLVKKDLVNSYHDDGQNHLALTNRGQKIFVTATGKECSWGGAPLLEVDETPAEEKSIADQIVELNPDSEERINEIKAAAPQMIKDLTKTVGKREAAQIKKHEAVEDLRKDEKVAGILETAKTKAAGIRELLALGLERKHIAQLMEVRYQMVYQVEQRQARNPQKAEAEEARASLAEAVNKASDAAK